LAGLPAPAASRYPDPSGSSGSCSVVSSETWIFLGYIAIVGIPVMGVVRYLMRRRKRHRNEAKSRHPANR